MFFIVYTCSWIILIIVVISLDKIKFLESSIILRLLIISLSIAILVWILNKKMPKINAINLPRGKIALIIIAFEAFYIVLRGMIPDEVIPNNKIIGLFLRYIYSLIVINILLKAAKDD